MVVVGRERSSQDFFFRFYITQSQSPPKKKITICIRSSIRHDLNSRERLAIVVRRSSFVVVNYPGGIVRSSTFSFFFLLTFPNHRERHLMYILVFLVKTLIGLQKKEPRRLGRATASVACIRACMSRRATRKRSPRSNSIQSPNLRSIFFFLRGNQKRI